MEGQIVGVGPRERQITIEHTGRRLGFIVGDEVPPDLVPTADHIGWEIDCRVAAVDGDLHEIVEVKRLSPPLDGGVVEVPQ